MEIPTKSPAKAAHFAVIRAMAHLHCLLEREVIRFLRVILSR